MYEENILEKLRGQIDNVDNEIMILLKRRLQIGKKLAQYKIKNSVDIEDKKRECEIINNIVSKAINMDIDKEFAIDIFERIIEENKKEQLKIFNNSN